MPTWPKRRRSSPWAKQNAVSWTFWAYANTSPPMNVIDYRTNQPIQVVQSTLAAGQ